jgi:uncharacterized protein (DUF924 family)
MTAAFLFDLAGEWWGSCKGHGMNAEAEALLGFWLDEVGPVGWYEGGAALDAECRERFLGTWERGRSGAIDGWACTPRSTLALIVLFDQLPRNMFRDDPRAFATDAKARAVAKGAIGRGYDLRIDEPARQFFYMPLEHSETISDQGRAVRMFVLRFGDKETLKHARAHRAVIRRFGRFPYRNAALGRRTTPAEAAFLADGGYRAALAEVG